MSRHPASSAAGNAACRAVCFSFFINKVFKHHDSAKRTSSFALAALFVFHFSFFLIPNSSFLIPNSTLSAQTVRADSLLYATADSIVEAMADSLMLIGGDSIAVVPVDSLMKEEVWSPDPARATWMGIAFPGGGQIYNRKYWKLPIVYGGFLGCAYALTWNNQMYKDYSQAYLDIMDDDDSTASYADFLPPNYNVKANEEYLKRVFKNRKDNYRRYRDLSIFSFIGVYAISIIDAYVDAELSHFDISEDLGFRVRPSLFPSVDNYSLHASSLGVRCSLTF